MEVYICTVCNAIIENVAGINSLIRSVEAIYHLDQ